MAEARASGFVSVLPLVVPAGVMRAVLCSLAGSAPVLCVPYLRRKEKEGQDLEARGLFAKRRGRRSHTYT